MRSGVVNDMRAPGGVNTDWGSLSLTRALEALKGSQSAALDFVLVGTGCAVLFGAVFFVTAAILGYSRMLTTHYFQEPTRTKNPNLNQDNEKWRLLDRETVHEEHKKYHSMWGLDHPREHELGLGLDDGIEEGFAGGRSGDGPPSHQGSWLEWAIGFLTLDTEIERSYGIGYTIAKEKNIDRLGRKLYRPSM